MSDEMLFATDPADMCRFAYDLSNSVVLNTIHLADLAIGVLGLAVCVFIYHTAYYRKILSLTSPALSFLIRVTFLFYLLGNLCITVFYLYTMLKPFLRRGACPYMWTVGECVVLRSPMYYFTITVGIIHAALMLDRLNATVYSQMYNGWRCTAVFTTILGALLGAYGLYYFHERVPLDKSLFACVTTWRSGAHRLLLVMKIVIYVDLLTALGNFVIYLIIRKRRKRRLHNFNGYNLSKSMELREHQLTMQVVFPTSVIHLVLMMPYMLSYPIGALFQINHRATYTVFVECAQLLKTCYFFLVPLLMTFFHYINHRKDKKEWLAKNENAANNHFKHLRLQFENGLL